MALTTTQTAILKLHDLSQRKRRVLDTSSNEYSDEFRRLLQDVAPHIDELREAATLEKSGFSAWKLASALKGQFSTSLSGSLREALYKDAAANLKSYFVCCESDAQEVGYPAPKEYKASDIGPLLEQVLDCDDLESETELKRALYVKEKQYRRAIPLIRYRVCRLLRSPDGKKMWADLKLGCDRVPHPTTYPESTCVRTGDVIAEGTTSRACMLAPLELSRRHMHHYFREGTPKTSKLVYKSGEWYLHIAFEFDTPPCPETKAVVGVDRGRVVVSAFAAVDLEGNLVARGGSFGEHLERQLREIDREHARAQHEGRDPDRRYRRNIVEHRLHSMANDIVQTAAEHDAIIALEDLDNLKRGTGFAMSRRQYGRLEEYVTYKAKRYNLRVIDDVPPAHTSITCPECGCQDKTNRVSQADFHCTDCGHADNADANAARNIALRGLWIVKGGKKDTGCDTFQAFVRSL